MISETSIVDDAPSLDDAPAFKNPIARVCVLIWIKSGDGLFGTSLRAKVGRIDSGSALPDVK